MRLGTNKPFWTYDVPTAALIALGGLVHLANVGVASELTLPNRDALAPSGWEDHPERRGYVPLKRPHRSFAAPDQAPYPVVHPTGSPRALSAGELALLKELFDGIRALGARPVVLIPPVGNDNLAETDETLRAMQEHFAEVPVLAFHPGGPNPELYQKLAYWEDMDHLSIEGSAYFSRLLAERFLPLAQAAEDAP